MKFAKSKDKTESSKDETEEPKNETEKPNDETEKASKEEYAEHISTLTENELRDLHKDLQIDHYCNTTAAAINTVSRTGLRSIRPTARRFKTESMQITVIEARMKENGWTPHPHRYRDAVPIALGVAAETTSGKTLGLINVEKNAKRTRDYVKKKDLFNTKQLVVIKDTKVKTEEPEVVEKVKAVELPAQPTQSLGTGPNLAATSHTISRKPVPASITDIETKTPHLEDLRIVAITDTSVLATGSQITESQPSPISTTSIGDPHSAVSKAPKRGLLTPISAMNKKLLNFTFGKEGKEGPEATKSVTDIARAESLDTDTVADPEIEVKELDASAAVR